MSEANIREFIRGLKMVDLLNWKRNYVDLDVLDGTQWEVEVIREKRNLKRGGSNKFPTEWDSFCMLIRNISSLEFE